MIRTTQQGRSSSSAVRVLHDRRSHASRIRNKTLSQTYYVRIYKPTAAAAARYHSAATEGRLTGLNAKRSIIYAFFRLLCPTGRSRYGILTKQKVGKSWTACHNWPAPPGPQLTSGPLHF